MKQFLADLRIYHKLLFMLLLPITALLYFALFDIGARWRVVEEMTLLEKNAVLVVNISAFVHELQKERGITSGFVGSKGQNFSGEIQTQRAETDKPMAALKTFLQQIDTNQLDGQTRAQLTDAIDKLEGLGKHREAVTALSIPPLPCA